MIHRTHGSPGFTLLEVAVALGVTALMVVVIAMSFHSVVQAHQRASERLEIDEAMNLALERVRELIQATYITPYPLSPDLDAFKTFDEDKSSAPYDAITIKTIGVRTYRIDAKEADINEVTVFTVEEKPLATPEGKVDARKLKVRIGGEINDKFEVEGGLVYTLAEHVTRFLLEYLDQDGEWKQEWLLIDHPDALPCAVRVTLGLRSATIAERTASIMVPLEMSRQRCRFEMETLEVQPE